MGYVLTIICLLAASASASVVEVGETQFWQSRSGQVIPGQYIVIFNDQVQSPEEGLERLKQHVTSALGGAAAPLGAAAAAADGAPQPAASPFASATTFGGADPTAAAAADADAASNATAAAGPGPLVGAVLRLSSSPGPAPGPGSSHHATPASGSPTAAVEPPEVAAIRSSGIVSIVEADSYAVIQQATCVPSRALAGALPPAQPPAGAWPGCAGAGAAVVWFGERCGAKLDRARYMGAYAVNTATGAPIPGCVLARNSSKDFTAKWLGGCGAAPALAPGLPTVGLCAPSESPSAACVGSKQVAGGMTAVLPRAAACGAASGASVSFKGARCGPGGRFVRWTSYAVDGAGGRPCARADAVPSGMTAVAAAAAQASSGGGAAAAAGVKALAGADMMGSCGVPPMAHKELPVELCAAGATAAAGGAGAMNLPRPMSAVPTEGLKPSETVPWGISRIEANLGNQVTKPLPGTVVGIIDTGIDPGHPDLTVAGGASWVGGDYGDENGHGTHVAGTISASNGGSGVVGVAPGTPVFALRVLDRDGVGSFSSVVQALNWVARYGPSKKIRVVNLSLGGDAPPNPEGSATCAAVKAAVAAGVAVVVAAGNAGGGADARSWTTQIPAACPDVIVATAISSAGAPASFSYFLSASASASDRARQRTLAAPGVDVRSTWPRYLGSSYKTISGTSMASPHIAGVVAKCFAVGVCTSAPQAVDAVAAAARARNIADASYGYRLDPFFARSRVGVDRYYGPLVHAGWRPAA